GAHAHDGLPAIGHGGRDRSNDESARRFGIDDDGAIVAHDILQSRGAFVCCGVSYGKPLEDTSPIREASIVCDRCAGLERSATLWRGRRSWNSELTTGSRRTCAGSPSS